MTASKINAAAMQNDEAALEYLEGLLWPNGPVCPHCGATDRIYALKGKTTRLGLRKCGHCRKPFTVTVGTLFERSHVPLHKWVQAFYLLCSSKKGISSHQLHRILGVTYKAAWFMAHRIREAMRDGTLAPLGGGNGNAVEADETFIGRKKGVPVPKGGPSHKHAVLALVERGGKVRTFHINSVTKEEIGRIVRENVAREAWLMTDEARHYTRVGEEFAGHGKVHHALGEYVDPDDFTINTTTPSRVFSACSSAASRASTSTGHEKHFHRYLAEFEFRYNYRAKLGADDTARAARALEGARGKRLTYRHSSSAARTN
jgi:transposase-like protein